MGDLKLEHRTYTKINTLYKRNMNEGEVHHILPNEYSEEEFEYLKNNLWACTLKVDGTNVHYQWDGHTLEIHGKSKNAVIPSGLSQKMETLVTVDIMSQVFPLKYDQDGNEIPMMVRIYGEGCGHNIQGKCGRAYNPNGYRFIMFNVLVDNWWLTREVCEDIANRLNIEIVDFIGYMTLEEAENMVKKGFKDTMALDDLEAEGLVCIPKHDLRKRNGERIIVKIKTKDYREYEKIFGNFNV